MLRAWSGAGGERTAICFPARLELSERAPAQSNVPRSLYFKRNVLRVLIGVFVYAQLAFATYACNMGPSGSADVATLGTMGQSHGPAQPSQVDPDQASLCAGHCQSDQQNADTRTLPVPPLALVAGYFSLEPLSASGERDSIVLASGALPPLADPPHAVLHCCLRI